MEGLPTPYRQADAKLERRAPTRRSRALPVALALAAAGLLVVVALALHARGGAAPTGDRLADRAAVLAAQVDPARPLASREILRRAGGAAELVGRDGRTVARTGARALWARGGPGPLGRVATLGTPWSLRDGAVEADVASAAGGRLRMRAALAPGAGPTGAHALLLTGLALALVLLAAGAAWRRQARRARALERLTTAAESVAAGRADAPVPEVPAGLIPVAAAIAAAGRRVGDLQDAAEARFDPVAGALGPLPIPAAARTPLGGRVRNGALERMLRELRHEDAAAVEEALREGLGSTGACARPLPLPDGRRLEVESWPVTGGRVVALVERGEQERLAAFRRRLTGAAARHLHAPVSEVQALASDLHAHVPAGSAPAVRRILAAADRMERLVSTLLRGTDGDAPGRPTRSAPIGAAGLLWGLGRRYAPELRARELRLHPSVEEGLPPVHADPGLVEEVLRRLIDNAVTWTPRGGDIHLAARRGRDGGVDLEVRDTGPGIPPDELGGATERFARGAEAASRPGAGLGLASAAALAGRLGGRLVLAPGPGGRATLELPATSVPAPVAAAPADATPAGVA